MSRADRSENKIRIRLERMGNRNVEISFKRESRGKDRILLLLILGIMVLGFTTICGLFVFFEFHRHKNPNLMPNETVWERMMSLDAGELADWVTQSRTKEKNRQQNNKQ